MDLRAMITMIIVIRVVMLLMVILTTRIKKMIRKTTAMIIKPARSAMARRACALRALGLLLYSRIPQWEGGRLFEPTTGFFYGNSCNSGTESRKIVPKVGN